jgi:hypothetical protein
MYLPKIIAHSKVDTDLAYPPTNVLFFLTETLGHDLLTSIDFIQCISFLQGYCLLQVVHAMLNCLIQKPKQKQ